MTGYDPSRSIFSALGRFPALETLEVSWELFKTHAKDFAGLEKLVALHVVRIVKAFGVTWRVTYKLPVALCFGEGMDEKARAMELKWRAEMILKDINRPPHHRGLTVPMDKWWKWAEVVHKQVTKRDDGTSKIVEADHEAPGGLLHAADKVGPARRDCTPTLSMVECAADESWVVADCGPSELCFGRLCAEVRVMGLTKFIWDFGECECPTHWSQTRL